MPGSLASAVAAFSALSRDDCVSLIRTARDAQARVSRSCILSSRSNVSISNCSLASSAAISWCAAARSHDMAAVLRRHPVRLSRKPVRWHPIDDCAPFVSLFVRQFSGWARSECRFRPNYRRCCRCRSSSSNSHFSLPKTFFLLVYDKRVRRPVWRASLEL
jgi:hypothetical protein